MFSIYKVKLFYYITHQSIVGQESQVCGHVVGNRQDWDVYTGHILLGEIELVRV